MSVEARPGRPPAGRQRNRILDAAERLIGEGGCAATSIEAIVARAGVSTVTFYEHFADKEACFVAALDRAVEEGAEALGAAAAAAGEAGGGWLDRARAALSALLAAIETEPDRARLCLLEAPSGSPGLRARYEAAVDRAAAELRRGRLLDSAPRDLPDTLEEAAVGSVAWLLRERLERGGAGEAEDLLEQVTEVALDPFRGRG
ncbi:MAG TPA: helix-turn-helix domain-containing protein [Solirubrobacterales bacterium]|nr:helix-turn-helix domain-containing protein [Solirubrobacterales bacterium]